MAEDNEIVAAARDAKAVAQRAVQAKDEARRRGWRLGTLGLGAAIGSAAVAAAVLYANRSRSE